MDVIIGFSIAFILCYIVWMHVWMDDSVINRNKIFGHSNYPLIDRMYKQMPRLTRILAPFLGLLMIHRQILLIGKWFKNFFSEMFQLKSFIVNEIEQRKEAELAQKEVSSTAAVSYRKNK